LPASNTSDVVIVGGGVIGLSVAYALAKEGIRSTVLDCGEIGRAASWAGAGMIPPFTRRLDHGPMIALRSAGAVLHRDWSAALRDETGIDNGYRVSGGLDVAVTEADEIDLRAAAGRWRVEGIRFERVEPADFPHFEPALSPSLLGGYFLPDRAQIRNPRHLKALRAALEGRGVTLRPRKPLLGFELRGDRVIGLRLESETLPCSQVVVAAGAWSGGLLEGLSARVPTPPLKGQIVLLRGDRPLLGRIVEHGKNYLVPRDDGRILVGASEEDVGFDTRPMPGPTRDLIDEALRLCPTLAEAEVERTWAGLRPGSIDTRPTIGWLPGSCNVVVATGHKRAGLQLAPSTAEVVVDLLLGRSPRIDLAPFAPGRLSEPGEDVAFRS
jgi:glycine oxidase